MNLIGRTLGQYCIKEPLGQGGMASVFKAYQPALDRFVAVKVLPAQHALTPGFSERFVREARAVAQLNHPNILPIIDFGQEDNISYLVTKVVSGGTLKDRLRQPLDLTKTVDIIEQIASALDHAHGRGIVHRDVKPSNVLLDEGDWVQLADFGLAKIMAGDEELTASGVGIGTPAYMSPEQGQGLAADHCTDIYSLGVILYEIVVGQRPFQAEKPMALIIKHIMESPPPPRQINPAIPEAVEAVILKAMAKTPTDRYPSAGEMARALREAITLQVSTTPAILPSEPLTTPPSISVGISNILGMSLQQLELAPPPEPTHPPQVNEFVGREAELTYYADELNASHLTIITGMAGVGKTALAVTLAQQVAPSDQIFWHTFHEGEGTDGLLWKLAGFLAWRGQENLWRMLQGALQTGGQTPPFTVLLDYLFQMLRGRDYLLCFDDLHFVEDDPLLAQLMDRLREVVERGELSLIITSRRVPDFVEMAEFEALAGLSDDDTNSLLTARGVSLSEDLIHDLYTHTEGNAELLTLSIDALSRAQDPARVITRLTEAENIERFLMAEVDKGLTEEERKVMSAVALLLGYSGTRDAIETILDGGSVRRVLGDLSQRYLLSVSLGEWGKEYGQHAIVGVFYYDLLGRRERREMHRRAGEFYEIEEPDALRAARHYEQGGEIERAAELATADVWALINQGQAQALRHVLERFKAPQLDTEQWAKVNIARGQVHVLLGEGEAGRKSYQEALSQLTELPDSPTVHELRARACRGMGESLHYQSPQEALNWFQRGLEGLANADVREEAALHIRMGYAQAAMGNHKAALSALKHGLNLLPEGLNPLRALGLLNLGTVYCTQGDIERGQACYLEALKISQQLGNYWRMVDIKMNIAIQAEQAGDWQEAVNEYEQALDLAEQLGSTQQQAALALNLGDLKLKQGEDELAEKYLSHCLTIVRSQGFKVGLVICQVNLAKLHTRRREIEAATAALDEAEGLALEIKMKYLLPEIYCERANVQLLQGNPQAALEYAERSVSLARELQLTPEEGQSLRVLGQALLADGQTEPALVAFEKSLLILDDLDPYEAARTRMQWGRHLLTGDDAERGKSLLEEASVTFQALDARHDEATVQVSLAGYRIE